MNRRLGMGGIVAAVFALLLSACGGPGTGLQMQNTGPATALTGPTSHPNAQKAPPSLEALMTPGPLGDRYLGKADAPVTIIEYASLTCPYCRAFYQKTFPKLKRAYIDTGKVRYIRRAFPIGRASGTAHIIQRCAPEKAYFTLFDKFITRQREWVAQKIRYDAIFKIAAETGMTRAQFDKCLTNRKIEDGLKWVKERAREFGVIGTPTFFVNGKKMRGFYTFEEMKAVIDPLLS